MPKSITTAIGIGVSEELGGYVEVTVAVIIITRRLEIHLPRQFAVCLKLMISLQEEVPMAIPLAMEMGAVEWELSSLSIVVAGILTVISAPQKNQRTLPVFPMPHD